MSSLQQLLSWQILAKGVQSQWDVSVKPTGVLQALLQLSHGIRAALSHQP
ncbi:MAG TPA: hypothetical protein IGP91_01090 [Thermosynechococcus sp. M46_R2017_013]|nr:hypothetical protein [Thermosynechococcus sp. M46_R2017_013]